MTNFHPSKAIYNWENPQLIWGLLEGNGELFVMRK